MKAFLLAAGIGSRLRPITDTIPKCMVDIDGRPLLEIWLEKFAAAGVDEVLVNLHHLPDVVRRHVKSRMGSPIVRLIHEPELLGSAGTLVANRSWIEHEDLFLVCNADNLTDFPLSDLIAAHRVNGSIATLAVFHSLSPSEGGVVETDGNGLVLSFAEKPAHPASDLVNAGMYSFSPAVLDAISQPPPVDLGYYLLPQLVGRARTVLVEGYFRDIGTADAYRRAREEWPARVAP